MNNLDGRFQHFVADVYTLVPYHIPLLVRRTIAGYAWVTAGVAGVLQMMFALLFLDAGRRAEEAIQTTTYLSRIYGAPESVSAPDFFFYAALVCMCLLGILMLLAVPGLRCFDKRRGWDILFYALFLNIVSGFIRTMSEIDGGLFHGIVGIVISVVGIYILFEILPHFAVEETKKEDVAKI